MEFKCKICAGSLTIDPKTRIAKCDYCGTKQVLPMFGDDSSKILYERGNQYLLHNEYDKAESIFNQLLSVNPNDAEIYWDLVLCKYGVTYAKDPKTEEYIPTCNRTHTESIFKNENYLKAVDLSPMEKATLYKKDAEIIDRIQKGILEVSRKEKPFDIFISYKETDENGYRTKDSIEAQKLYEKLTELGYKVFFSRITLESKVGEEYEPIIYAALSSSKVMITVCSSGDYIQSAWVKNEWSRFLILRRGEMSKTLIPVYFDMDTSELPEEFALLPAQNMKAADFEQELLRGIKKLIPTPITRKEQQKKIRKIALIVAAVVVVVGIPAAYLITKPARDGKKRQEEYALEMANKQEQYNQAMALFDSGEYETAKQVFESLSGYENADEMAVKCDYYGEYLAAMDLYYERNYPEATWAFLAIGDYKEVQEMLEKCKRAWRETNATVADDVAIGKNQRFAYYISPNGTISPFSFRTGNSDVEVNKDADGNKIGENELRINEHGSIVSMAGNDYAYALYEDGFVCNSAYNNNMKDDWQDVIQISDRFNVTNVALHTDGTVLIGDVNKVVTLDSNALGPIEEDDTWLVDAKEWSDIVKIDWAVEYESNSGGVLTGMLVGLNSAGTVRVISTDVVDNNWDTEGWYVASSFIKGLSGITDIRINNYELVEENIRTGVCVAAIDRESILHILTPYGEEERNVGVIKDFWIDSDGVTYIIDSQNRLMKVGDDKTILEGAVYVNDGFCVTQSGTVYNLDGSSTECKTQVRDVWIER